MIPKKGDLLLWNEYPPGALYRLTSDLQPIDPAWKTRYSTGKFDFNWQASAVYIPDQSDQVHVYQAHRPVLFECQDIDKEPTLWKFADTPYERLVRRVVGVREGEDANTEDLRT